MTLPEQKRNTIYTYIINAEIDSNSTTKTINIDIPFIMLIEKVYIQAINNSNMSMIVNISKTPYNQNEIVNTHNHLGTLLVKEKYQSQIEVNIKHLLLRGDNINVNIYKQNTDGNGIINILIYYRYVYE